MLTIPNTNQVESEKSDILRTRDAMTRVRFPRPEIPEWHKLESGAAAAAGGAGANFT